MTGNLPANFFAGLRQSLFADIKLAVEDQAAKADLPPVYAFVMYYHPLHGELMWQFHREDSDVQPITGLEQENHPDGARYELGSQGMDCTPLSKTTESLLGDYAESWAETPEDFETFDHEDQFEACLVEVIQNLEPAMKQLPTTSEFVAFAADVDGVDPDILRRTVAPKLLGRVFPTI